MKDWGKALVAECLGTFALCVIGAGVICTNYWTTDAIGLVGIALAHGAVLGVMISALGHHSGGHFNPAVTVGLLTVGRITRKRALGYVVVQLAGSVLAGYLLLLIFPERVWQPVHLGTPGLSAQTTMMEGVLVEILLTFFLVLTVCGTAVDPKGSWNAVAGFGIGTVLVFDILMGGPLTGAAMNPARAFGPALASGYWDHHLVYWIGPLVGGMLAAGVYTRVFLSGKKR